jgi:HK97 gp10 family phage protein
MYTARVTGYEEIDRVLRGIEPKLTKKILRPAMRAGLKPMLKRAKALAPVGPSRDLKTRGIHHPGGLLRKMIKVKSSRSRNGVRIAVVVGEGDFKGESFYGAIQEYGGGGKGKGPRGPIKAKHFLKQAFDETNEQARDITVSEIRSRTDELVQ